MTRIVVIDTSYLTELYFVPRFSEPAFGARVMARIKEERGSRLVVPVGCLYKLCDHIADVSDGQRRRQLAMDVGDDVESSVRLGEPWTIAPANGPEDLAKAIRVLASDPQSLRLGLTNAQTVDVARAWMEKYKSQPNYAVHIWTRNRTLKALEPDPEPNPLM